MTEQIKQLITLTAPNARIIEQGNITTVQVDTEEDKVMVQLILAAHGE